ncbi:hypothetical protein H4R20_005042 [Coemansia guatemalensis]|uniref:Xylanolytic transcriptional activator regulatory domain-containing protein n=1 Tax=Coemansia guatemalensis TaxID=2761395 RepID=A0A9W8LRH6_9FUNG|nr:hypothetical protein H4R20_005042 [Coemansia guatemalensis]
MSQALTPLEAELRRRLWWTLFTNERFCAIAERLPTMVDEARMFVHLPCSARDWDCPEFTYRAPERVPRYQREGYMRVDIDHDVNKLTLGQEISERKRENLYMMSEIEYGFSMSHLVAFLADMGSLFRPRSPYGNDYTPMFLQMHWAAKMSMLRANVERVERIFEMVRQDILRMLADTQAANPNCWSPGPRSSTGGSADCDPVLDPEAHVSGIEIPHLHHLVMLILYSTLNIHLYRMVFQIHYEFSSSLPEPAARRSEDVELLSAFDQYVKELWVRMTTAARQVSRILRGEFPGVPRWVLALAEIRPGASATSDSTNGAPPPEPNQEVSDDPGECMSDTPEPQSNMDVERSPSASKSECTREQTTHRLRSVFRERIRAQETRLHEIAHSVLASFHRTLPYSLLLVAKVHIDNIKWWTNEKVESEVARTYLDLSVVALFLETHQALFSSTNYVSLVKGIMRSNNIKSSDVGI